MVVLIAIIEARNRNLHFNSSFHGSSEKKVMSRNPTIFNIIRWVAGLIVSLTKHLMSEYYFDRLKIKQWVAGLDLGHSKLFIFIFVKL